MIAHSKPKQASRSRGRRKQRTYNINPNNPFCREHHRFGLGTSKKMCPVCEMDRMTVEVVRLAEKLLSAGHIEMSNEARAAVGLGPWSRQEKYPPPPVVRFLDNFPDEEEAYSEEDY